MLKNVVGKGWLSAMAHITGGGITGNLPRVLPRSARASVDLTSWPVPAVFRYLAGLGKISAEEMLRTFNMGIGMILVVPPANVKKVEEELKRRREKFHRIGKIETGTPRVAYSGRLGL